MSKSRNYACEMTRNFIKYELDEPNKVIYMVDSFVDENAPKIFFVLLRSSIDDFIKQKYKKLQQTILLKEWKTLENNKKWNIIDVLLIDQQECVVIQCELSDAIYCMANAYNIKN